MSLFTGSSIEGYQSLGIADNENVFRIYNKSRNARC